MNPVEFSKIGEKNLNEVTLVETKSIEGESKQVTPVNEVSIPSGELFWIPLSFLMVWTVVVLICSDIWKITRGGMINIQTIPQSPCRNCQFFSNNAYLKCAVNPSAVLTKEAMECSEYLPEKDRKITHK